MLFEKLSPIEMVGIANVIALSLADNLDADDLNVLGQLFSTVGDVISLIAAQKEYLITAADKHNVNNTNSDEEVN